MANEHAPVGRQDRPAPIPPTLHERELMRVALADAGRAAQEGEIPVGALLLDADGTIVGSGRNAREATQDPTAHAEVLAIREAAARSRDRHLTGCTLVVTLEPCAMCTGTILAAGVSRVVFGAWDEKAGASGSVYDLLRDGRLPYPVPEVVGGVLAQESAALLAEFFRARR